MKRFLYGVLATMFVLSACQTAPKVPEAVAPVPEAPAPTLVAEPLPDPVPVEVPVALPDRLTLSRDGFSPLAMEPNHTVSVAIEWSTPNAVLEWALEFAQGDDAPVRVIRGTQPVPSVVWDGRTNAGVVAAQGQYQARLFTALADGVLVERVRSQAVWVDVVPPSGKVTVTPQPYQLGPANLLVNPPNLLTIELELVSGGARWATWRVAVFSPDGRRFQDFINEDYPQNRIVWDGRSDGNAQMTSGLTYRLDVEVFDIYGNRGVVTTPLVVGADPTSTALAVVLDGKTLAELPVYFPPYSSDLTLVKGAQREANDRAIKRLVDLLLSAPTSQVRIVGHANQVLFADPVKAAYEQRVTLLPLSLARAAAVKRALEAAGVPPAGLTAVGVGAADPVAAFSDVINRWKNRRVVLELQ